MASEESTPAREAPHSVRAEEWLLGSLVSDHAAWSDAATMVSADDFHHPPHRLIFRVLSEMADAGQALDLVTLSEELSDRSLLEKAGGADYLAGLAGRMERKPGSPNVAAYARIVRDKATLRGLIDAGRAIAKLALEPGKRDTETLLDDAERQILALRRRRRPAHAARRAGDIAVAIQRRLDDEAGRERSLKGVSTGLRDLDAAIGGLLPSELIVIGGRPAMGTSTLMTNLAERAVLGATQDPRPVLFFSLDDPADLVVSRLLASIGRIDLHRIRSGSPPHESEKLARAIRRLSKARLYLEDGPHTINDLCLRARQTARKSGGLKLILVDSLQRIRPEAGDETPTDEDPEFSWSLKTLAREMQCPVIAGSKLNRRPERRASRYPELSDLRGSGSIEHDADVVLLLYREDVYRRDSDRYGVADIILAKHPTGRLTTVELRFSGRWARFDDLGCRTIQDDYHK